MLFLTAYVLFIIFFIEKPELVHQPVREERVIVAHTIRLSCGFTRSPTPQVTWFKNGERIVFNGRIKVIIVIIKYYISPQKALCSLDLSGHMLQKYRCILS